MARAGRADSGGAQRPERLDRFLGDALIGAMVLLGLVFCVGAARAQGFTVSDEGARVEITQNGCLFNILQINTSDFRV
jgi:hypothetical protein